MLSKLCQQTCPPGHAYNHHWLCSAASTQPGCFCCGTLCCRMPQALTQCKSNIDETRKNHRHAHACMKKRLLHSALSCQDRVGGYAHDNEGHMHCRVPQKQKGNSCYANSVCVHVVVCQGCLTCVGNKRQPASRIWREESLKVAQGSGSACQVLHAPPAPRS